MKSAQTFYKHLYNENKKGIIFFKICSLFIILISCLLTSINAQATISCNFCGIGEYKKVKLKDYLKFPESEEKSCLDTNNLVPYEYTSSCEENAPLNIEQSDKQYLIKCSHCAELLYVNGWYDNASISAINCRSVCPIATVCACALATGGLGVYLCQLNSALGYVCGSCSFVVSGLCGVFSYCSNNFRKEYLVNDTRCSINNKILEILEINDTRDTEESVAMIIGEAGDAKEIHGDGCFLDTIVKAQINACHNTSVGKSDIRTITKEEVMVLALYEIWSVNSDNNVEEHKKIRYDAWNKFHKTHNRELNKQCFSYLKTAHSSSISLIFIHNYNYATASENNINIDTKDYDNAVNGFKMLSKKAFLENNECTKYSEETSKNFATGQVAYYDGLQSNKFVLIKSQLNTWAEDHETIKSFIISITFRNNGSIQILFDKDKEIGNGWNIHYPELLGDNIYNISLDNMIKIFNFLYDSDNKLNYKDVKIIIPDVLSLD